MSVIMEPYRIKVVEPLAFPSPEERRRALEGAGNNLFKLTAEQITIDLLTDSGTSAMSADQWSSLMRGDETYAGARSFDRFRDVVSDLTSYRHILPAHQGRAAESVLFTALLTPGQITLSNSHFDTTRANVELSGCEARDLLCREASDPQSDDPFKGNIDLDRLHDVLSGPEHDRVALVIMTVTNNGGGGQPVSMANLRAARALCDAYDVPLFLDAARFAENAWLITQREAEYAHSTPREVAREAFGLADGAVASLKKDGIANMGGLLALNDDDLAQRCRNVLIAREGFPTYGGLAGRDLEALAQGLLEVTDPRYLSARASAAAHLADLVNAAGIPTVRPTGLHAVYIDAGALLPHIPAHEFPAHSLACALYLEAGVRSTELGTLTLGHPGQDGAPDTLAPRELLRLALPRRAYTRSHLDYVGEALGAVARRADALPGYRIVDAPPVLRHFSARLEPTDRAAAVQGASRVGAATA
ncbi:tryptophanase [Streptomyces sp. SS]|uniref:tryptophanase n=1 Tax=Streptomyces sp. SS TaxID=260742 RepID=UPI000303FCB3|nr:tryptophanase [Streptomyces sp. SS]